MGMFSWVDSHWSIILVIIVTSTLIISGGVGYYVSNALSPTSTEPRTFCFFWEDWQQKITPGKLWLNMTFSRLDGNLSIIAKVNDNENKFIWRNPSTNHTLTIPDGDGITLIFDSDHDGKICGGDRVFPLSHTNSTEYHWIFTEPGFAVPSQDWDNFAGPSPYHTCTFNNQTGYTFNISISLDELNITNDMIYVLFTDDTDFLSPPYSPAEEVSVTFCFGKELIE